MFFIWQKTSKFEPAIIFLTEFHYHLKILRHPCKNVIQLNYEIFKFNNLSAPADLLPLKENKIKHCNNAMIWCQIFLSG